MGIYSRDGMDILTPMYELLAFFWRRCQQSCSSIGISWRRRGEFAENMLHEIQAKTRINELKRKMNERVAKEINKGK